MLSALIQSIASALKITERKDARQDGRNAQKAEYLELQMALMRKFRLSERKSKEKKAAERREKIYGSQRND